MASLVMGMESDYIVYKFYEEDRTASRDTDDFFTFNSVGKPPVILVFNKGKLVQRHSGIVESEVILRGIKTRKEQEQTPYPDDVRLW